jgi:hypothetical protein
MLSPYRATTANLHVALYPPVAGSVARLASKRASFFEIDSRSSLPATIKNITCGRSTSLSSLDTATPEFESQTIQLEYNKRPQERVLQQLDPANIASCPLWLKRPTADT